MYAWLHLRITLCNFLESNENGLFHNEVHNGNYMSDLICCIWILVQNHIITLFCWLICHSPFSLFATPPPPLWGSVIQFHVAHQVHLF